jgi:hypothetical protein
MALVAGCGSGSSGFSPDPGDSTAPAVASSDPLDLELNVAKDRTISVTFSEEMDQLTLNETSFALKVGANPVAGTVTSTGTTATLTPNGDLQADTVYTATISRVATDVAGNPLDLAHTWTFSTGASPIILPDPLFLDPVVLGGTSRFAVLAGYAITNVPASDITGDVGISPSAESFLTGFAQTDATGYATSAQVHGSIFAADMASPTPAMMTAAMGDLTIAYLDAAGRTPVPTGPFLDPGAGDLAGLNLAPGLYKFSGAATATTDFTLTGSADAVWIFQISTSLIVSNGVHLNLAGGAKPENIFWQVGTQATLGTTVVFAGTIMADASITMNNGATLDGRALAFSGTVALDQNIIAVPVP